MKISKIVLVILLIMIGVSIFLYLKNENHKMINSTNIDTGEVVKISPGRINGRRITNARAFEYYKSKERKKILYISSSIISVLLIFYIVIATKENRKDPIKNLARLRDKNIITKSEYETKIEEFKIIKSKKRKQEIKNKESEKLIKELENLKKNGVLSEEEFNIKLKKIKNYN